MSSGVENAAQMINKQRFYILGAFDGQKLAGIISLDYKCGKLPQKYNFPSWCNTDKMVEFAFTIVATQYRGQGLMFELLQQIKQIAIYQGYEYACCTVHKDNYPSKKMCKKLDLNIICQLNKTHYIQEN